MKQTLFIRNGIWAIIPLLLFLSGHSPLFSQGSSLPTVELADQENGKHTLDSTIGVRNHTLLLLYRSRKAAEAGDRHLELVRQEMGSRGIGDFALVRIADLSRVPGLFRGLAARQLKKEFSGYPYYVDTSGDGADHFGVADDQCGLVLYQSEKETARSIIAFTSLDALDSAIRQFLSTSLAGEN